MLGCKECGRDVEPYAECVHMIHVTPMPQGFAKVRIYYCRVCDKYYHETVWAIETESLK